MFGKADFCAEVHEASTVSLVGVSSISVSCSFPSLALRPLLRVCKEKEIFLDITVQGCCHYSFFFLLLHKLKPWETHIHLPLPHCSCSPLAFGFPLPPISRKKAPPREKVAMATAFTTATPQSVHLSSVAALHCQ